jgi:D-3-phosphoglycerate dehydrogenase
VISIHVSGSSQNVNLIGRDQFKIMKKGAIFINMSRGNVVEINALAEYLRKGHLKGAAIDVFPQEPENGELFHSPLQGLPNTILTPHIAGSTQEAQKAISGFVSNKMLSYLSLGDTRMSINFPQTDLPHQSDSHRILHIHKNIPELGVAIFDVSGAIPLDITESLRCVPGTIRVRILY